MTNSEIKKHEILKQACIYSYNINNNKIPTGYKLEKQYSAKNGFYACVLKKDNDVIIAYRGTTLTDPRDIYNDVNMLFENIPTQARNALNCYIQEKNKYSNCDIIVTGHSLGGSLAQIVGAITGVKAITFNAYGTGDLFKNKNNIHTSNIVNYCNPEDPFTQFNILNQLGKCYEVGSNNSFIFPHFIEKMKPLNTRILSTPKDLKRKSENINNQEEDYYLRTGKHTPIRMGSINENQCSGSYPVSGYTRRDGTEVDSYIRTCYIHGK